MRIYLLAVGTKMPAWVSKGYDEYAHRMPTKCKLVLKEIPAEKRSKNSNIENIQEKEAEKLLNAIPNNCRIVALDGKGSIWTTEKLAVRLEDWMMSGQDVALLIGGPDGLTHDVLSKVNEHWSLSNLTFPHPLVRIIVAEQLYRAWSITENHPYHRAG
ncbi:MAG: 23S rRNA (pseudouridine(1915)-N(3))-methyltransferase RlmH [Aquificaceae bacterium]|nr:MAG: 23S rRNA (pseudouridine(1915)-N(3))-methyltransferase RlmH [Aquificaceae bacterium]